MLGYILDIFPQVMEKKAIPVHSSCSTQLTTDHQKLTFVNWKSRHNNRVNVPEMLRYIHIFEPVQVSP
jgi:hypothetical protein